MLSARGIAFDCFEKGSQVGGNWRYENDNGMSSAYRSLHINTSRRVMASRRCRCPTTIPDYPNHFQIAAYFDEYVDHFGLRERIRFRTEVVSVEPVDGEWEVTVADAGGERETDRYRAVLVANGHHWDPRWPEPAFPGAEEFEGEQIHAHHYREPDVLRGKRVLVLGIGNSATDIAVESSRIADETFLAMRRGAYVLPKYLNGKPTDEITDAADVAAAALGAALLHASRMLGIAVGDMTDYGLPEPDHKLLEAHPTVSAELLPAARPRRHHGQAEHRPLRRRPHGPLRRRQRGGDRPRRLLHGLQDDLPVLRARGLLRAGQPPAALPPGRLGRAPGALLHRLHPAARADHAAGRGAGGMGRRPARRAGGAAAGGGDAEGDRGEEGKMRKRFVASKRHTIEVDFHPYLREIRRERKLAAQRA